MSLITWRFVALLLAALGMTMGAAHVLEMAPKMHYDGSLYATVNSTLYRQFATVGGPIQIGAIVAAAIVTYLVRDSPAFRWTLSGTLGLVLSFGLWLLLVVPVNTEWAHVLSSSPESAPTAFLRLRERWEYGHVAAFLSWLTGVSLLLISILVETPTDQPSR
jgi:hypothetical protein